VQYNELIEKYDKGNMLALMREFPDQCKLAIGIAKKYPLNFSEKCENIFIQGMGGSGIGGAITRDLLKQICKVPIVVGNSYELPAFVDKKTLAFFVSYSGNTEETIAAFKEARKKKAIAICVSSNGMLAKMCRSCIKVPAGNLPRTMLAFLSLPQIIIIERLGLLKKPLMFEQLPEFLRREVKNAENIGKRLAERLYGQIPVLYAGESYSALVWRIHGQLAENSGMFSHCNVLPEMNHNEIVGFKPSEKNLTFLFFRTDDESAQMMKRFAFTKNVVSKKSKVYEIRLKGRSNLERMFYGIMIGDFMSYYLALLNGKDPSENKNITKLKKILAR